MGTIELDGVDMVYPDGFHAVRNVDLSIRDGDFRVLLGPSGCGKSTVLRMIAGLEQATGGEIRLDGRRVNEIGPRERDVAMAFQQHALYPHMTVAENLGFPLKVKGMHSTIVHEKVCDMARTLGLLETLSRKPSQLSGGQQQRVALGRSLIRRPRIVLMDEPFSNLDSRLRLESRSAILRLQRRLAITTVFVTHDQSEAMALADDITVMRDGAIAQSGPPLELYRRPVDLFVAQFLGSPEMNVFVAKVMRRQDGWGLEIGPQIVDLVGAPLDRSMWSKNDGRIVAVGIRPEELRHVRSNGLVASVESTELIGNERLVNAVVTATPVTATSAGVVVGHDRETAIRALVSSDDVLDPWQPFAVSIDARSVYLFDLESGRALETSTGEPADTTPQASSNVRVTRPARG